MNTDGRSRMNRRAFLLGSSVAVLGAGTPTVSGQETAADAFEEWMDDVPNYEGVVDFSGEETVEALVGAGEDGFQFEPPAVAVDPGTTVRWEWTGDGGSHDVVHEVEEDEEPVFESEFVGDAGHEFEHTFEDEGIYLYGCTPHIPQGMKGAVVVGDDAAAEVPVIDAEETTGNGQGIPLVPGIAGTLAIMVGVVLAISRWTKAGRDTSRMGGQ